MYPFINQTFDARLIDRFYMCSFYEMDITSCDDNEVTPLCRPYISVMHMFEH